MEDLDSLYQKQEELQSAIDDAAEADNGTLWEDLNDELEELEEEIARRETR